MHSLLRSSSTCMLWAFTIVVITAQSIIEEEVEDPVALRYRTTHCHTQ